ncbi:glycosyltransferase [Dactylosporangium sp. NPDC005555]|uniref:glycosyltransferase n=1 Tax=Dactylosporangium sp. NPDC005555 TaxID=3154889 RepID=UPI0033A8553D
MAISYGFLSTHPPTLCGLASFSSALAGHLPVEREPHGIVRVTALGDDQRARPDVTHTWRSGPGGGWRAAADVLGGYDVAVVQHEYGIYPGRDGEDLLPLLRRLTVPSIVVLHTVLTRPSHAQRTLLEKIMSAAGAVVTLTGTARDRLVAGYAVDATKVHVIPHGVDAPAAAPAGDGARPHLLTWGLLGPGKGIEWAVRALARLRDLDPQPTYTVAGQTHPKVLEHEGETYRSGLRRLTHLLDMAQLVRFRGEYLDRAALSALVRSADVVVLPYDSREQVTSGVLVEAVAAGIPVVATAFPHAVELLTDGPGLVVPHQDAAAMAAAVRRILTEPGLAGELTGRGRTLTEAARWPVIARRYAELARGLVHARPTAYAA